MLALHPQTVDLAVLPPKGQPMVGVHADPPRMAPQDATAKMGRDTLEASAELIVHEVQHRLAHKNTYLQHGWCLREGLWKEETPA